MSTNLTEAQRNQVLQYISATAATKTLTAEQFLSCTADEKKILVKAGLIAEEELEKNTIKDLIKIKLDDLLANDAISASDKKLILDKLGVTGVNLKEASSWKILGKSIGKTVLEKLKWLALTPTGWITLAVTAVIGACVAYAKWGATLENTREKLEELKSECNTITSDIESLNSELETIKQKLAELEGKDALTFTEQEEYDNLVKQNNELQRQLDLQKLLLDEKNKDKNKTFVETMEKSNQYSSDPTHNKGIRKNAETGAEIFYSGTVTEEDYINRQFYDYQKNLDKITELDELYKDNLSNKKYKKERERIEKENEEISQYLQGKQTEFTTDSKNIEYIDEPKNEDEEKVNKWLDFINDFQDRMAIAMGGNNAKINTFNRLVDNWQFNDLVQGLQDLGKEGKVTTDMLNDPKYDEFIKKLVELGVIDSVNNLDDIALAFNSISFSSNKAASAINNTSTSLATLKEQLERISSAYNAVSSAIEEYNKYGTLSVDTVETLLGLENSYLGKLIDENGQLTLNTQSLEDLTVAKLESYKIGIIEDINDYVDELEKEKLTVDELAEKYKDLAVNKALSEGEIKTGYTDKNGNWVDVSNLEKYKAYLAKVQLVEEAIDGVAKGGLGGLDKESSKVLNKLKNKFDKLELSINKVDDAINLQLSAESPLL